ncbi:hypothetical protein PSNTI_40600 [Stutzerimonas stutzeri]|nr:hypothetical protein PSNTI_40600 [Stutzerimonas stutzeri]
MASAADGCAGIGRFRHMSGASLLLLWVIGRRTTCGIFYSPLWRLSNEIVIARGGS